MRYISVMEYDSSEPMSLYADALAALARIAERQQLSPVRRPWKVRRFLAERLALAWIDDTALDSDAFRVDGRGTISGGAFDLTHWHRAVGAPITLEALMNDAPAVLDWLGVEDGPASGIDWHTRSLRRSDILPRVADWQSQAKNLSSPPPLLYGARLAMMWRSRTPIGKGDAVAGFLIGDRHGPGRLSCSFGGLAALGMQLNGDAWKIADQAGFDRMWLRAIVTGAQSHLDLELRLRNYATRASAVIAARRRTGRLPDVITMAMANPYVTSRQIADRLGLTSAGAIKLLAIATEAGLLIERSGQGSYRNYAIPLAAHLPRASPKTLFDEMASQSFWDDE
ncbi:hypothetical protein [Sphingobium sp.]|uniref:hypothetical protein n=1 Tax=Sphingobium sp. TaxID=1912891 RepID=UPI003B3B5EB0